MIRDWFHTLNIEDPAAEGGTGGGAPEKDTPISKNDAIDKAIEDLNAKDEPDEDIAEQEEKDEEEDDDELTEDEQKNARKMYLVLKHPEQGKILIEAMAKEAGIIPGATKEEQKQVAKSIAEIIAEEMGDEYKFLSGKLTNVITKAVSALVDEKTKDIRDSQTATAKASFEAEFDRSINNVVAAYKEAPTLLEDMYKLMDQIQPGKGITQESYFKTLLYRAAADKDIQLTKVKATNSDKTNEKINRNRADASSRLASEDKRTATKVEGAKSKPMTLQESLDAAEAQVSAKMGG